MAGERLQLRKLQARLCTISGYVSRAGSARPAAALFLQAQVGEHHAAVHGLDHVVDGEQPDRGGGERLHLDAGAAAAFDRGDQRDRAALPRRSAKSTATRVIAIGCASGISSAVRLAAWIAAMRATPSTSPLVALPATTARNVAGAHHDAAGGDRDAMRFAFRADVHHVRAALAVEMRELRRQFAGQWVLRGTRRSGRYHNRMRFLSWLLAFPGVCAARICAGDPLRATAVPPRRRRRRSRCRNSATPAAPT